MVTVAEEEAQGGLEIVHCKTYVVPAVPVNAEAGLEGVVTEPPLPLKMLHKPVPTAGVFPASVVEVSPHMLAPV